MFENLQIFASLTVAIFIEAAPFLLIGSLLASLFEVFAEEDLIARLVPKNPFKGILFGIFIGMLLPTCECGIVPIVRRMLGKGVPPATAIAYMLAAPVINPIVMVSTYVAFRGDLWMVGGRVAMVAIAAAAMGWVLSGASMGELLLNPSSGHAGHSCSCCHDHHHDHGHSHANRQGRLLAVLQHTAVEFLSMGKFLLLGAIITALFKTFTPAGVLNIFESSEILAIIAMMILAIVLSVCSEADAFVAASFSSFPPAAQLAFMAIGPMVDLKLIAMFSSVFKRRIILCLIMGPIFLVFCLSIIMGVILGRV